MENGLRLQEKTASYKAREKPAAKFKYEKWIPYLFISPTVLLVFGFLFYPLGNVFYYSLQNYNLTTPYYNGFIGLDNFVKIFTEDPQFFSSLGITFKWVVAQVGLQLVFGMGVALLLNQTFKFRAFARAAAFIPWAISGVLASVMWSLMYNEHMGVINDILLKLGIIDEGKAWLADIDTAFPAVIIAELWRGIPFFAITLLASLQSIPVELYEAAKVDGAGRLKTFLYITLPQLKNTIVLTTLLRTIWEFNNIDLIYNLTGGGPAHQTTTLTMYIAEQAIHGSNFGYGSALTVVSCAILLVFAIAYLRITRFEREAKE
ncbi:carbohydrate ABC transporter permease [Paenactinomyces guangxiensis]|uniref:Sugar ABC transporter permease n=1 Tax=Paenactinomyces guangxiensis TaxID=1490290 RepID=A0A7W1WP22_9BACL|nr:sugar ABC transporter permease [Paenactinomyces guangxiensis]MBA4493346.1 sugar ABC transporter permease [Paenactinomyces guangxiensis]MBH8593428.1 sugar ABC transporter permease [Paenactinomyces guangxiensis]